MSQEAVCAEIQRESAVRQSRDTSLVGARAVDMHTDISQEPFCAKKKGNWLDTDENTLIKHPALTLAVRTPQCGHTNWEKHGKTHHGQLWF